MPDAVCHIIAAHAAEGDLVKRTTEAYIVHHADFMAFLPFKNPKNIKDEDLGADCRRHRVAIRPHAKETITATMSRWAAGLRFEHLSPEAVYQAKRFLLDSLGCALGGYQQHDVEDRARSARRNRGTRPGHSHRHRQASGCRSRRRWPMR